MATATESIIEIRPQAGPQEAFLSSEADIVIYGGAAGGGKSWALLMEPLRHVENPNFSCVIFRRESKQVTNPGGLWDESGNLYQLVGAEPRQFDLSWRFPSGAIVRFGHIEHEKNKYDWQGSQIVLICFDELTTFTESQFFYMLSRNRSTCGVAPYFRATCNPDAASWVAKFISWWIDQDTGFAIPERAGVLRWFVRVGNRIEWGDSPEQLREMFPDEKELSPKSVTFVPAKLEDNPKLMEVDPGYRGNLLALPRVDRERLLNGNWKIQATEGAEWEDHPEYFENHIWANAWPKQFPFSMIALDASKGSESKSSDYSAIVFCGWCASSYWVDCSIKKRSAAVIVDDVIEMWLQYGCGIIVEENGFQYLFIDMIEDECRRREIPVPLIIGINRSSKNNKLVRMRELEAPLKARQLRIRRNPSGDILFSQLRDLGAAQHDDGPDALQTAWERVEAAVREGELAAA